MSLPVAAKAALALEIARLYVPLRWRLRTRGLPAALELARREGGRAKTPATGDAAARLAGAVDRTLRALPADSRCLMRALVLCAVLARRGIPTKFVIGVRGPGSDFIAHAWVELDGRPLQPTGSYPRLVEL